MKTLKTSPLLIASLAIAHLVGTPILAHAETYPIEPLVALARAAVVAEVTEFNTAIATGESPNYPTRFVDALRADGMDSIDPAYLAGKCFFDETAISAALDRRLDGGDDRLSALTNGLAAMKGNYGRRIWKLASLLCERAEDRFAERLTHLTHDGVALDLDEDFRTSVRDFIFTPTGVGAPSGSQTALEIFTTAISAAMIIGSSGSLIGLPFAGKLISTTVFTNTSHGLGTALGSHSAYPRAPAEIENSPEIRFDLLPGEVPFATAP